MRRIRRRGLVAGSVSLEVGIAISKPTPGQACLHPTPFENIIKIHFYLLCFVESLSIPGIHCCLSRRLILIPKERDAVCLNSGEGCISHMGSLDSAAESIDR